MGDAWTCPDCGGPGRHTGEKTRAALALLLDVCERMDGEHIGKTTQASEEEYQAAIAQARAALELAHG